MAHVWDSPSASWGEETEDEVRERMERMTEEEHQRLLSDDFQRSLKARHFGLGTSNDPIDVDNYILGPCEEVVSDQDQIDYPELYACSGTESSPCNSKP